MQQTVLNIPGLRDSASNLVKNIKCITSTKGRLQKEKKK